MWSPAGREDPGMWWSRLESLVGQGRCLECLERRLHSALDTGDELGAPCLYPANFRGTSLWRKCVDAGVVRWIVRCIADAGNGSLVFCRTFQVRIDDSPPIPVQQHRFQATHEFSRDTW